MAESDLPVFIHSLFRSGSTYLFDVFRRSPSGYWCYQEPENEILLRLADTGDPLADTDRINAVLRHPQLDKPYLAEFMPIRSAVVRGFRKHFPYDTFFLDAADSADELRTYLELLIREARGRPVLQFCRSTGRLDWLRHQFAARHLFLWRHPWDQWWSYKVSPYFDTANLLILNAHSVPPVFEEIRRLLSFQPHRDAVLEREFIYFDSHGLSAPDSYLLFFSLWYHAMHEGLRCADVVIGLDALSCYAEYRQLVSTQLTDYGIGGLDFSGCRIFQGYFSDSDSAFFRPIEDKVVRLFATQGYSKATAERIAELRIELPRDPDPATGEEIQRLRAMLSKQWTDAAHLKRLIWDQRLEIERLSRLEAELLSIYRSRSWKLLLPFFKAYWSLRGQVRKRTPGGGTSRTTRHPQ